MVWTMLSFSAQRVFTEAHVPKLCNRKNWKCVFLMWTKLMPIFFVRGYLINKTGWCSVCSSCFAACTCAFHVPQEQNQPFRECCVAAQCCWHSSLNAPFRPGGTTALLWPDHCHVLLWAGLQGLQPLFQTAVSSPLESHRPLSCASAASILTSDKVIATGQPPRQSPVQRAGHRTKVPTLPELYSHRVPGPWETGMNVHNVHRNTSLSVPCYRISQQQPWENGLWTRQAEMGLECPRSTAESWLWQESRARTQLLEKYLGWQWKRGRREICTCCPNFPIHWIFSLFLSAPHAVWIPPQLWVAKSGQYARWADPCIYTSINISLSLLALTALTHPKIKFTFLMAILTSV